MFPNNFILLSKKNARQKYHKKQICPHLKFGNKYANTKVKIEEVVSAIIYKLQTGCQWRKLPMREFFKRKYRWNSVFYHFVKWSKNGSWQRVWAILLEQHKHLLDMSSIQLDGSHTPAKRGGEQVEYQGRKKCKTTNLLFLTDAQGLPLCCSEPIAGNHNDAHEIKTHFASQLQAIQKSNVDTKGLFLNADSGFDVKELRNYCYQNEIHANIASNKRNGQIQSQIFDEVLYKQRFVIERTNAWLDGFRTLLIRFETNKTHWKDLHIIAFMIILCRRL